MHWPQAASAGQYVRAQLCFLHHNKCILRSQSTHVESCYFATVRNFTDLDDIEQGFSFNILCIIYYQEDKRMRNKR